MRSRKPAATWVWTGERRAIHLTSRRRAAATFSADGLKRIAATLATERDPNHKLLIGNYVPVAVLVRRIDHRQCALRRRATCSAAVARGAADVARRSTRGTSRSRSTSATSSRYCRTSTAFVAVDINVLDLKSTDPAFRAAHGIDSTLGQPQPHLLMLPARPVGSSGTVLPAELAYVEVPAQDVMLRATGGLSL